MTTPTYAKSHSLVRRGLDVEVFTCGFMQDFLQPWVKAEAFPFDHQRQNPLSIHITVSKRP